MWKTILRSVLDTDGENDANSVVADFLTKLEYGCFHVRRQVLVKVWKIGQQRNDTKIAIHSNLTFPLVWRHSVDVFCRFSRLQTRSDDLKTLFLFSVNFRFPDTNLQHYLTGTQPYKQTK